MSIIRGLPFRESLEFGGAWLLRDAPSVDFRGALRSQNVEYTTAQVGTRHGFAAVPNAVNRNSYNLTAWYGPFSALGGFTDSSLVWVNFVTHNVEIANLNSIGTATSIGISVSSPHAAFVPVGMRMYAAFYSNGLLGTEAGKVITVSAGPTYTMDPLFLGPMIYPPAAPVAGAAGNTTPGTHRLGYLVEFRTGFTTRVSPDTGAGTLASFAPVSFTATANSYTLTLNPAAWPIGAAFVSVVMTTSTNLNQYYIVPGSRTSVPSNAPQSTAITLNISDGDLSSQGTDATPYLFLYTQTPASVAPFQPTFLSLWGSRMAYLTAVADNQGNLISTIYVSDPNSYQNITADQHVLQLPGQRPITTLFRLGETNYACGPHEIWAWTDSGDVPVSWTAPTLIDGRHGTPAAAGVEVAPGSQYAWIADQSGLYVFSGGPLTALPVSFQQTPDWNRINWTVAKTNLIIKDDVSNKRVHVMVPLDGQGAPTHIMTWDYTNGATHDTVRYSLDNLTNFPLGSMEIVRNDLPAQPVGNSGRLELWLGPRDGTAPLLRKQTDADTNPFRDYGSVVAIPSVYRTALFPGKGAQTGVLHHHGFHSRITGSGSLAPVMFDMDQQRSFTCATKALGTVPDVELLWLGDLRSELACVEFNTTGLAQDTRFRLTSLKWYYSPWMAQR